MQNYDVLIKEIQQYLELEVPEKYKEYVYAFNDLVNKELFRASFKSLNDLSHLPDWSPSNSLKKCIERYKVVF